MKILNEVTRSTINTEVLPFFIEFVKKERLHGTYIFLGSLAYQCDDWMYANHRDMMESSLSYRYDFISTYGKNWYRPTFYKAIESVYGKQFLKDVINANKKTR